MDLYIKVLIPWIPWWAIKMINISILELLKKLDDVVNYIPARLSAWFMILGARISQMDYKNAIKIFKSRIQI